MRQWAGTPATNLGPALSPGARIPVLTPSPRPMDVQGRFDASCLTAKALNAVGMLHSDSVHVGYIAPTPSRCGTGWLPDARAGGSA